MTTFDNKEKAEENKYAHDKETEFLVRARYHKLLAVWAAGKMGLEAEKKEEYKNAMVTFDLGKHDETELLKKIKHDFSAAHVNISEHDIRKEMHELHKLAREQVIKHG